MTRNGKFDEAKASHALAIISIAVFSLLLCIGSLLLILLVLNFFTRHAEVQAQPPSANPDDTVNLTEDPVRESAMQFPTIIEALRLSRAPPAPPPTVPFSEIRLTPDWSPYNEDHRIATQPGFVHHSGESADTLPRYESRRATSSIFRQGHWV